MHRGGTGWQYSISITDAAPHTPGSITMSLKTVLTKWKQKAEGLKYEIVALYWAYRDPRTPWYARVFMAAVLGYALSPIDLIPDFIPVLGYIDDLIIVPAGIYFAIKMIPGAVMAESRAKARTEKISTKTKWIMAGIIIVIWLLLILLVVRFIWHFFF
jgi:uncharacterized membrane protein YkvA (DUF1232 family)